MLTPRPQSAIRNVPGIEEHLPEIRRYLQGLVNDQCRRHEGVWFYARTLVGGDNRDWGGTPLYNIYVNRGEDEDAVVQAGRDVGWILMSVLNDDQRRTFETDRGWGRCYRLVR